MRKSTLSAFLSKDSIQAETFYDNSVGSGLLFRACAGSLETSARTKYRKGVEGCPLCLAPVEDVAHVVQHCPILNPLPQDWTNVTLPELLGLNSNLPLDEVCMQWLHSRLSCWWQWRYNTSVPSADLGEAGQVAPSPSQ